MALLREDWDMGGTAGSLGTEPGLAAGGERLCLLQSPGTHECKLHWPAEPGVLRTQLSGGLAKAGHRHLYVFLPGRYWQTDWVSDSQHGRWLAGFLVSGQNPN